MGRYACTSQEVLIREGRLVGFNAGYGYCAEHQGGYKGKEQRKIEKADNDTENPFYAESVTWPESVFIMEFDDKTIWLTNNETVFYGLANKTDKERRKFIEESFISNIKRQFIKNEKQQEEKMPEILAFWDGIHGDGSFDLVSTAKQGCQLLKKLYAEMQKENVAISSDYSFMFKDRGLSFIIKDQLTEQDMMNKKIVNHHDDMVKKLEKEYYEFLIQEGLICTPQDMKWQNPIYTTIPQVIDFKKGHQGELNPVFFINLTDNSKTKAYKAQKSCKEKGINLLNIAYGNKYSGLIERQPTIPKLPVYLTGDEIKVLVSIIKSQEFIEYAENNPTEEVGQYLLEQLEQYHESEKTEQNQYMVGEKNLEAIAIEQRTEVIDKQTKLLNAKMLEWLHPSKENDKEKTE